MALRVGSFQIGKRTAFHGSTLVDFSADLLDRSKNFTVFNTLMHELKQSQVLNMLNWPKFGLQNLTPNLYKYCLFLFSAQHSSPPLFILPNVTKTRLLN